jgi:membrane associated rhomboid family serine protease
VKQAIKLILTFLMLIWAVYFASLALPLNQFGLVPRTTQGLIGIITAPFLHGSLMHLVNNSISFILFAVILAMLEGNKMFTKVALMIVIGGTLTWLLARSANHIGASGLIFSLLGYMLLAGWFSGKLKYLVVSLALIFFYGGMIFGVLPGQPGISWDGHLFGFIAGIIVAWVSNRKIT